VKPPMIERAGRGKPYRNKSLDDRPNFCYTPGMGSRFVAYYRVSTERQGRSGLGLDGQRAAVAQYAASAGCTIVAEYTEVETGKKDDLANRPELRKALSHAKRAKATLVIAKLDRLARSVYVTATLHRSGVDFIAVDNPTANRMTIQILAAVAENEARAISERTKAALAAAKERGTVLGATIATNRTREGTMRGVAAASRVHAEKRREAYADLAPVLRSLRAEGLSLRAIARRLSGEGDLTRHGRPWNPVQVARVLAMADVAEPVA